MEYDNFDRSQTQIEKNESWFRRYWWILWIALPVVYLFASYFFLLKMYPLFQFSLMLMPDISTLRDVAVFMSPLLIGWIVWMLNKTGKNKAQHINLFLTFVILITLIGFGSILTMFHEITYIDVDKESAFGKNFYLVIYASGSDGRGYIIYSCTRLSWCDRKTLWSEVTRVSNDADLRIDRATRTLSIWVDNEAVYEQKLYEGG